MKAVRTIAGEQGFQFFLPYLLDKDLIEDDSDSYSAVAYNQEVMSRAAREIVPYIGAPTTNVHLEVSKRRVKFMMEFLGVALALPVSDYKLMRTARQVYRGWMLNLGMFGSEERQNKYIRRMVKQLSAPFGFRGADDIEMVKNDYIPLLSEILDDFLFLATQAGPKTEPATWLTLLNVCLGIADMMIHGDLHRSVYREVLGSVKEAAVSCAYTVMICSRTMEEEMWVKVEQFYRSWSSDVDFLCIWGKRVNLLFQRRLATIFNCISAQPSDELVVSDSYSLASPISDEVLARMFHRLLDVVDLNVTKKNSNLTSVVYKTIITMEKKMRSLVKSRSKTFMLKFPAIGFLKLIGRFLVDYDVSDDDDDTAIGVKVSLIIRILALLDPTGAEEALRKLTAMLVLIMEKGVVRAMRSFCQAAEFVLVLDKQYLPIMAATAMRAIPMMNDSHGSLQPIGLCGVVSLFVSSFELMKYMGYDDELVARADETAWQLSHQRPQCRFELICHGYELPCVVHQKMQNMLEEEFTSILQSWGSMGPSMLRGCISYIGHVMIRHTEAEAVIARLELVQSMVVITRKMIMEGGIQNHRELVIVMTQMFVNMCLWTDLMKDRVNVDAFFTFVEDLKKEVCPIMPDQTDKLDVGPLITLLINTATLRAPSRDHFSRRLDSGHSFNEETLVQKLGFTEYSINYYTVGSALLVSFIEAKDSDGPAVVFARGPFGRTIWTVDEDVGDADHLPVDPDDKILPETLPAPATGERIPLDCLGDKLEGVPVIPMTEFIGCDDSVRQKFGRDFSRWLDVDRYAYCYPDGFKGKRQRPRVIDFLTMTGVLKGQNKMEVRSQNKNPALHDVIAKLDHLETVDIMAIPVIHILPTDVSLKPNEQSLTRMTPLMQNFMRGIAEPMKVSREAAALCGLPPVKTSVPMLPGCEIMSAVILPAMIDSENPLNEFNALRSRVRIIFNETSFALKQLLEVESDTYVLIVRPALEGTYHVSQQHGPDGVVSPFGCTEILTTEALSFKLGLLMDMVSGDVLGKSRSGKRYAAIDELCTDPAPVDLAVTAMDAFE